MENLITYDFGYAIKELKEGFKVRRQGWNGKGMWLKLVTPFNEVPYVEIKTSDNTIVPLTPSQTDMLATDWERA